MLRKGHTHSKSLFDGNKGRLLLQISKTYQGDERFKLDSRFKDDVEIEKLPQKFKQIAEKEIIEKIQTKTKLIKKEPLPLIISRFEPSTEAAGRLVKKAEGRRNYIEGLKRSEMKKKSKVNIKKGVDKVKQAERLLSLAGAKQVRPKFKMQVKGDRKEAFQQSHFKMFEE